MGARLLVSFSGLSAPGVVSVSGLKAGDYVLAVTDNVGNHAEPNFARVVVADNELTQCGGGLSGTFWALIEREVMLS